MLSRPHQTLASLIAKRWANFCLCWRCMGGDFEGYRLTDRGAGGVAQRWLDLAAHTNPRRLQDWPDPTARKAAGDLGTCLIYRQRRVSGVPTARYSFEFGNTSDGHRATLPRRSVASVFLRLPVALGV